MQKTACILIIGNEVLSGRTKDANLSFLATELNECGIQVRECRVIPDVEEVIVETLNHCRAAFDYVFTTGGIGPTHDDITAECVAKAFGRALIRHPEAERLLRGHYRSEDINEARLSMANTPEGASLVMNPVSVAPGFQVENVFVLAGIPKVAQAMFDDIRPRLEGGKKVLSWAIATFLPEGLMAQNLGRVQADFPEVDIGSYPFFRQGNLGVSLVLRHADTQVLERCVEAVEAMIRDLGGVPQREGTDHAAEETS